MLAIKDLISELERLQMSKSSIDTAIKALRKEKIRTSETDTYYQERIKLLTYYRERIKHFALTNAKKGAACVKIHEFFKDKHSVGYRITYYA